MIQDYDIVLVGCGQMGSAILRGLRRAFTTQDLQLLFCDADASRAEELASELDGRSLKPSELVGLSSERARLFLCAVKPYQLRDVLDGLSLKSGDVVVSVAAGVTLNALISWSGHEGVHVVRTMPNTPALVGAGVTGVYSKSAVGLRVATALFESVGEVVTLKSEDQFHGLTAISGSGPAYVFTILEALADGGVLSGLDRVTARKLAVETLLGAATLVKEHPEQHTATLKDNVASPGGTTITALRELERHGLRHALISAVDAAAKKSQAMGK